jgi:thioredoxin 1
MPPIKVSDASFQNDVLNAKGPVVVDFWAEWCGPCKMIAPALDELSTELNGKVTIAKITSTKTRTFRRNTACAEFQR